MEEVIRKLNILRDKICFMRDSKEKGLLIKDYYNMVSFLFNAEFISSIDEFDFDTDDELLYEDYYQKDVQKIIKKFNSCSALLEKVFQQLINYYQKFHFTIIDHYGKIIVSDKDMHNVLPTFFWNVGDDALKIYYKMIEEKRVVQNTGCKSEGLAINTMNTDFAYAIIANEKDDLEYYLSIAHEMGHIYAMYLERNNPEFANVTFTSEVVSLLFEKLFLFFLQINDLVPFETFKSLELHHQAIYKFSIISKIITELEQKGLIKSIDFDLLTVIPSIHFDKIREMCTGYGLNNLKQSNLNLATLTYPIGEIISNHFFYQIIENHDLGMKELKDFMILASKSDLSELISLYMLDLEKSYHYIDDFILQRKQMTKSKRLF